MLVDVDMTCSEQLIRRFIAGDATATGALVERASTSDDPAVLVAAALVVPAWQELLGRACAAAESVRDRQVVAVAAAHLSGDADRALLLARDHLAEHPDSLLVSHIADGVRPVDLRRDEGTMTTRRTAALMVAAAVLLNVAFTGLATVFGYPDVLSRPADDVLASFRASQFAVTAWFLALALGAAMLATVAVGVGRLAGSRAMRWAVPVGIAAAAVQVVGLLRWPLLVPGWAATAAGDDPAAATAAREAFSIANRVLGSLIGETGGYLLTAAWTGLVLAALGTAFAGRWFVALGAVSAVMILAGVASPLGLPLIDTANFVGYILWSAWLLVFAGVLVVQQRRRTGSHVEIGNVGAGSAVR